ncbi:MAG: hypothetical protein VXY93_19270, partial [Pseudomonadota bacterium]|nr:hypothetical protein [Pseudomonadota bacterium]
TASGINVVGTTDTDGLVVSGVSTFTGAIDANGDLDVDGHTNLDNVNISGVTTTAGNVDINADLDVDGHTNLDNVSIAGVTTFSDRAYLTHDLTITGTAPRVIFTDTDNNPDYRINVDGGSFSIQDTTNGNANRFVINNVGNVTIPGNFDVVGSIAGFGDLTLTDTTADSAAGPEFKLFRNSASPADADYLGQIKFAG